MDRRKFIKIAGITGLAAGAGLPLGIFGQKADDDLVRLTILSTNDMHSRIEPFPANDRHFAGMGGMARRAAMIKKIRQQTGSVLLLDAGDIFQGTPYYNVYKGSLEIKLMNEMGYDAATIGNHEFDDGLENLNLRIPEARFPYICSNYDFSGTILKGKTIDYKLFNKGGIRIGVYGLGVELAGLVSAKNYGKTVYHDPVEVARHYETMLKEKGADLVVALSHLGLEYKNDKISDVRLAALTSKTDIIIGGHTHSFLDKPKTIQNQTGKNVIVSQAGWGGLMLGKIDLDFSKKYRETVSIFHNSIFFKNQV